MPAFDFRRARLHLDAFDWPALFTEELNWLAADSPPLALDADGATYTLRPVARLGGVVALDVAAADGKIPGEAVRRALHESVAARFREHLLLFTDAARTQTVWSYPRYDGRKLHARSHHFVKGQPPDLFLSTLAGITFDLGDLDAEGNAPLLDVTRRLRDALDVERVTKKFYAAFKGQQERLAGEHLTGVEGERARRHFASVLLTRLMFVYFLQKKGFLDGGDVGYLEHQLDEHRAAVRGDLGFPSFYRRFLRSLFFEGFGTRESERSAEARALLGRIRYLNGGLFLEHPIEEEHPALDVADDAIAGILGVFAGFTWHLDDTPGGQADEINPDVLGYILEKYVNQKAFGAYYTPREITGYLCDATLDRLLADEFSDDPEHARLLGHPPRRFTTLGDLLTSLDDDLARRLLERLKTLTVLDPACGSGAFLVAALKKLLTVYRALVGYAKLSKDPALRAWVAGAERHASLGYFLKKEVITRNLYGVDLMEEAVEIAKLRLFLALVASAEQEADLEPLPNIDFNLLAGNSLLGLLEVRAESFGAAAGGGGNGRGTTGDLFAAQAYAQKLAQKNRLVDEYRFAADRLDPRDESGALLSIRDDVYAARREAQATLDGILAREMTALGVKVEAAAWDGRKARTTRRALAVADTAALRPFHWTYEFSAVFDRGGFDVIVANPPWDILKPNDKEFFETRSDAVSKNKMRIEDFTAHRADLLAQDPPLRAEYEAYLTGFPHQSAFFRKSPSYRHQTALVNGKQTGGDLNLYKLFLERAHHLLKPGGHTGIVIPSGIYTDLGAKGLRAMLFDEARLTALFGFENRRGIFEEVDSRFKFVVLTFEKGGPTFRFPAAFMRHDVAELARFPAEGGVLLDVEAVKRLSPASWSLMEFASDTDRQIAEKLAAHPALGLEVPGAWQVRLTAEFHMTNDSDLFETAPGAPDAGRDAPPGRPPSPARLPLYEGKMIHQFDAHFAGPRYHVEANQGRASLLGRRRDKGQAMDYQAYRLGFRDIAASTNERTMIAALLPPFVFAGNTLPTLRIYDTDGDRQMDDDVQLYLAAVLDSFTFDWLIRKKVTNHCNFFYVYGQPVPRLTEKDPRFRPLVERAARLVCTLPAFDALARRVGLRGHADGATEPEERARLRAELDGLVAHLYGLTEDEFAHVLTGFPLVVPAAKDAALDAYRALAAQAAQPQDDAEAARAVASGEGPRVEFKSTLRRAVGPNAANVPEAAIETAALKTLAALLNTDGGLLLIGVDDAGTPLGLDADGFPNEDKLLLHLRNLVNARLGPLAWRHLDAGCVWLVGKRALRVTAARAEAPVFVQDKGGAEAFYVRTGPATTALSPRETLAYCRRHFPGT